MLAASCCRNSVSSHSVRSRTARTVRALSLVRLEASDQTPPCSVSRIVFIALKRIHTRLAGDKERQGGHAYCVPLPPAWRQLAGTIYKYLKEGRKKGGGGRALIWKACHSNTRQTREGEVH